MFSDEQDPLLIEIPLSYFIILSMIQSYFDYCNVIWLNPPSAQVKKLQTLQNRALRLILNVGIIDITEETYMKI